MHQVHREVGIAALKSLGLNRGRVAETLKSQRTEWPFVQPLVSHQWGNGGSEGGRDLPKLSLQVSGGTETKSRARGVLCDFCFCEISRNGKSMEAENKSGGRQWVGGGAVGSDCLRGSGTPLGVMKMFWNETEGTVHNVVNLPGLLCCML